jgi:predicted Rossmann fold nucleotide-binding protein DprA/Smf involved in DNA uptake
MSKLSDNLSAYSTFLKAINRTRQPEPVVNLPPPGLQPEAVEAIKQAAKEAVRRAGPLKVSSDPRSAVLAALAGGRLSLAELSASTGLEPGALMDLVTTLEEFRLVRRLEQEDELAFELTTGGRNLMQAKR